MKIESEKISRRSFLKQLFKFSFGTVLLSSLGLTYARYIEPKQLRISRIQLQSEKIPKSFDKIKMILFSDTHLGFNYSVEQFSNLIASINEAMPDIVLFTGDLIDAPNKYKEIGPVTQLLKELRAPLGKFSIYGNHDHGGYGTEIYKMIMEEANFELLKNEHKKIYNKMSDFIYISGLDDGMLGKPNPEKTFENIDTNVFTILLAHQPDLVEMVKDYPIDVQLSGHSHGGQIQLPFIGPIFTPSGSTNYVEGFYEVGATQLYVNRGIGTTRVPFRFLCPPELTIFTLRSLQ
ncbi:metallophosphoesterase [Calidifontibacillus erzurumensis]|uniref:Metallophosphoesterase n=1 Tax=Calidifontibacillus erzurumensis TaxID=2741433 RepID=A0A8J8GC53_9BACI|nr:metallophosphoesterase [Calidifontibacillus erzurumensis]NSL50697.1 metallophosphoesterase [Calidifontibacillus erzurumensis]